MDIQESFLKVYEPIVKMQEKLNFLWDNNVISTKQFNTQTVILEKLQHDLLMLECEVNHYGQYYENYKTQLEALRTETQILVSYCELLGINPNDIFHFSDYELTRQEIAQHLQTMVKLNQGYKSRWGEINQALVYLNFNKIFAQHPNIGPFSPGVFILPPNQLKFKID